MNIITPRFLIISLIIMLFVHSSMAQHQATNWIFNGFTLNFKDDSVIVVQNDNNEIVFHNYASFSDTLGNVLFYTNGFKIWNRDGDLMENGDSLLIPDLYRISNQESIIVPKPGSPDTYFVFTVDHWVGDSYNHPGLYYAEVNMTFDGGLGRVLNKRIKLTDSTTNQIAALYHQNRKDIWILIPVYGTHKIYAYLISEAGVSENPVISEFNRGEGFVYSQIKGSPLGNQVVLDYFNFNEIYEYEYGFEIMEFNPFTGELLNPLAIGSPFGSGALEFSSDGTKLYVDELYGLYQYEIISNDSTKISESRTYILNPVYMDISDLQLAPDGKIYFTKGGGGDIYGFEYLGRINYPNEKGFRCEGKEMSLDVNGQNLQIGSIPNYVQNYFFKTSFTYSDSCFLDSMAFRITNASRIDSVKWCFGDNTYSSMMEPKHLYATPGDYEVTLIVYYPEKSDSIQKQVMVYELPEISLGNDTTLCFGFKLKLANKYDSIQWNDGTHLNNIIPSNSGKYWVQVKNKHNCQNSDTVNLVVNPTPVVDIGNDTVICDNSSLKIRVKNVLPNSLLLWSDNSTDSSIVINLPGTYWLRVENEFACFSIDEMQVVTTPAPLVNLGSDTTLSGFYYFNLDAGYFGYPTYYQWEDQSVNRFRYIGRNSLPLGTHELSVLVTGPNNCKGADTVICMIEQEFMTASACYETPTIFTISNTLEIDSVLWNFGDGLTSDVLNPNHLYEGPGNYMVTLQAFYQDTLISVIKTITIEEPPDVFLGDDVTIDYNSILTLDAGEYEFPVYYLWDDDSENRYRYLSGSILGLGTHEFTVDVTTELNRCKSSDTIMVTVGLIDAVIVPGDPSGIKIHPNPVGDLLTIETEGDNSLKFEICSIDGKTLEVYSMDERINTFDFTAFKRGVYILNFFDGNKPPVRIKIVKK